MIGDTYLELKYSQKSLFKIFCYNKKVTRKVKDFQNLSNKKIYFNLKSTDPSNSFHGQTYLRNTIFSVLISGGKPLLIGLRNALMYRLILYIHFFLPLNSAIHRMGNAPNILCPRCKEQKESKPYFYIFFCKLSKITLDFVN